MQDKCLDVEEPERHSKHPGDEKRQKTYRAPVTKSGEGGCAKRGEVRHRAKRSERHHSNRRVIAAEDILATARRKTGNSLAGEMFDRQVNRVDQSNQRDERRGGVEARSPALRSARRRSIVGGFWRDEILLQ